MARKKAVDIHIIHDRCSNCRFWRRLDDSDQMPAEDVLGDCLRYPPSVIGLEDGEVLQGVPVVEAQHVCGEHLRQVN